MPKVFLNGAEVRDSPLRLDSAAEPSGAATAAILYGLDRAGRTEPSTKVLDFPAAAVMLDPVQGQRWWITSRVGGSAWDQIGMTSPTATGTATAKARTTTNAYTKSFGVESLVTTAATTAVAGVRVNSAIMSRDLGFMVETVWGVATGTSVATRRGFCGVAAATAAPTDAEPSAQANVVGMGWDAADSNVQIMHNDGASTCTKVALGANFPRPAADRQEMYKLTLWCAPAGSTVAYRVERIHTGNVATGTLSADLPVSTTMLSPLRLYTSVGGTSGVTGCLLVGQYGAAN